jgi:APA family basic amino acid/polyamine antiporter
MTDERPLGARHVAAIVVGAIIGVGIFFTPATLARIVPTSAWVLAIWAVGAFASLAGALVFADLGARWPRAGGLYVFLREGFPGRLGSALSFLYGWLQLLVVQPGAMAVIAIVLADHAAYVLGPIPRRPVACAAIALFTGANLVGLKTGGRVQLALAALKIAALAMLIGVGLFWGDSARIFAPSAIAPTGSPTSWLALGLVPVLFTIGGAYHGTFVAGSVRDPERNVPRGISAGIAIVLVLYLAANVAYLALLGHDGLARSDQPAADAIGIALGPVAGRVVAIAIVLSAAGILNTVCLGFPFVIRAMAEDGAFFARAGKIDPRTGRPALAVALQGALGVLAVIVGASRVDVLLTGIAFADAIFAAALAVVHLSAVKRRYAFPGAAFVVVLLQLAIAIFCLVRAPAQSAYGAGLLVVGAIVWFAWKRGK